MRSLNASISLTIIPECFFLTFFLRFTFSFLVPGGLFFFLPQFSTANPSIPPSSPQGNSVPYHFNIGKYFHSSEGGSPNTIPGYQIHTPQNLTPQPLHRGQKCRCQWTLELARRKCPSKINWAMGHTLENGRPLNNQLQDDDHKGMHKPLEFI